MRSIENVHSLFMKTQASIYIMITTLALVFTGSKASAAEQTVNPTGTWSSISTGTNAQARPSKETLKLKLSGHTLTGTLTYNSGAVVNGNARKAELPITETKLDGNQISFNFSHPPARGKGPNASYTYIGKIVGDSIKGTVTITWMEHTNTRTWEAERLKQ